MANANLGMNVPKVNYLDLILAEGGPLAVASTAVVYSKCFVLPKNVSMGILLAFTKSAGVINVKVDVEVGIIPPATENAIDATNWGLSGNIGTVADTNMTPLVFDPVAAPYGRLKLTGQGSNDASVALAKAYFTFEKNL